MTPELVGESPDELFEDAPCGYVSTRPDGTIVVANRTFERITGFERAALVGKVRLQDLLSVAGRIYHETHYRPLLLLRGEAREIALDIIHRDGSRLPVLLSSEVAEDERGQPRTIRTVVFPAADRRSYEEELLLARRRDREVALQLQRSLLSGEMPEAPGLEVAVVYSPGVSGLEAGGDWYDAFWLERGETVALVIGDVVGRGIEAAAVMGQVRSALRALASTGLSPGRLLEALDRYALVYATGEMTTLVYAELSLATRRLRYACAGHPPPLVVPPGGEPRYLSDGRSPPLGVQDAVMTRDDAEIELEPESTIVLYTDGLVERRTRGIHDGMENLRHATEASLDGDARKVAERVFDRLGVSDHEDDVCLMVVRVRNP